jgi:L-malate glycosyltransferase
LVTKVPTHAGKIRVCIAAPSLDIYGGQAIQAIRLIRALSKDGRIDVEFLPQNPRLPWGLSFLQRIKYVRTAVTVLQYSLLLLVRMRRYDLVHVFSASYYSFLLSAFPPLLLSKVFRRKAILHYHSGEAEDHLRNWPLTAVPIMRSFDCIVVPSEFLVQVFARFDLKAVSIFNILELERFPFRDHTPLRPVFLSCRLLEPVYNVGTVIRAFHLIQQEVPEAVLTVAADGSQREPLQQLTIELGLKNVKFIGFVEYDRMPDIYEAHDVQLIGNDVDNMPAAITESCASGVALVSTNAGGIPFIVRHEESALLVNCRDFAAMSREALRLLRHPELARRIVYEARKLVGDYKSEKVIPHWVETYLRVVDRLPK